MVFLSTVITSANTHDATVAINTVDSMVIKRSSSKPKHNKKKQNLCLDKAYHSKEVEQEIIKRGYISRIRHIRGRKKETHQKESNKKKMGCRKNKFMA